MKHSQFPALAVSFATAVASCAPAMADDHPMRFTNSAIEQNLTITLIGSYQSTNRYNSLKLDEPLTQLVRVTAPNVIRAMAFDLVNADTNLLTPQEVYFQRQIATNSPNFLAGSAIYLRNEIKTNAAGTNLVPGVVIRRGTNVIDVTRFFPDLFVTNGLELFATNAPDQIQASRTGSSLNLQGLRLLSFQTTNMAFSLSGFATETSSKPAHIGTNFARSLSQTAVGSFSLNENFVVSNATLWYTNIVLTNNLAYITNVIETNIMVVPVAGSAHATIRVGGPTFRK